MKQARGAERIGSRAAVPSAPRQKVDLGGRLLTVDGPSGVGGTLWRIPYHWQPKAARLIGQEFESREALESAMETV